MPNRRYFKFIYKVKLLTCQDEYQVFGFILSGDNEMNKKQNTYTLIKYFGFKMYKYHHHYMSFSLLVKLRCRKCRVLGYFC